MNKKKFFNLHYFALNIFILFLCTKINGAERDGTRFCAEIGGFLSTHFSLKLNNYSKEKYPKIAQFGRGDTVLIFPPSSFDSNKPLKRLSQLVTREVAKLEKELPKLLDKDHNGGAVQPKLADQYELLCERMLKNPTFNQLCDIIQEEAVIAGTSVQSDACKSSIRALISHAVYSFALANRLPLEQELKEKEDALQCQRARNVAIQAELNQENNRAQQEALALNQLHEKYAKERAEIETHSEQNQHTSAELPMLRQQISLHERFDTQRVTMNSHNTKAVQQIAAIREQLISLQRMRYNDGH